MPTMYSYDYSVMMPYAVLAQRGLELRTSRGRRFVAWTDVRRVAVHRLTRGTRVTLVAALELKNGGIVRIPPVRTPARPSGWFRAAMDPTFHRRPADRRFEAKVAELRRHVS